jgi:hypothetical protein
MAETHKVEKPLNFGVEGPPPSERADQCDNPNRSKRAPHCLGSPGSGMIRRIWVPHVDVQRVYRFRRWDFFVVLQVAAKQKHPYGETRHDDEERHPRHQYA